MDQLIRWHLNQPSVSKFDISNKTEENKKRKESNQSIQYSGTILRASVASTSCCNMIRKIPVGQWCYISFHFIYVIFFSLPFCYEFHPIIWISGPDVLVLMTKLPSDFHCFSFFFIHILFTWIILFLINSFPNEILIEPSDHSSSLADHKRNCLLKNTRDLLFAELNKS